MNRPRPTRTLAIGPLESLDSRIVPAGLTITQLPIATQEAFVTQRAGTDLGSIFTQYVNYESSGAQGSFTPTQAGYIYTSGNSVGVEITFHGGDFNTLVGQLQGIGMQVTATSTTDGIVEGFLPDSQLPVVASNGYATTIAPVYKPTQYVTPPATTANEALVTERAGTNLGAIYTQYINYEAAGATGPFTSSLASEIYMSGTSVGVEITFHGGDFNTLVSELEGIGMQVTATSTTDGIVEGFLPIAQLPTIASNAYETSIAPVYKPTLY